MVTRRKQLHGQSRRAVLAREQARPREVKTKAEPKPTIEPAPVVELDRPIPEPEVTLDEPKPGLMGKFFGRGND